MQYTPRRLRLEKEKRNKVYKGQALRILIVALMGIFLWFMIIRIHSLVIIRMAKTTRAEEGSLENVIPLEAVLTRHEWVFTCPIGGRLQVVAKEGERVPEGALIAVVTGEGSTTTTEMPVHNIYAKRTGIVSYQLDGLESIFTPATITNLQAEKVYEMAKEANTTVIANQPTITGGTGFVKVVNNLKPLIIDFSLPQAALKDPPQAGDIFVLRLPEVGLLRASVTKTSKSSSNYRIVAESSAWPDQLLSLRLVELECILNTFEGLVIPADAITEKEGIKGVYKVGASSYSFVPIELVGQVGELAVVLGLNPGDEILANGFRQK